MNQFVAAPHPFKAETIKLAVPDGLTLAQMLDFAEIDPILRRHAHVWIGDHYIPRENWHLVRPKPGHLIQLKVKPHGGGGGKNIFRLILTIAVFALAAAVSGGLLAGPLGSGFAAGTIGAQLAGAAVGIIGNLLINVIAPIRPPRTAIAETERESPQFSIEGARNTLRPFSTVPVVLGTHRVVPAYGAQPYTRLNGEDQILRIVVIWGYGPLKIDNIRIGETPITDFADYYIETREGWPSDGPLTLYPDTVAQDNFSILLENSISWTSRTSASGADTLSVDIVFPQGLTKLEDDGSHTGRTVTFKIQYREVGSSTWLTPSFTLYSSPNETTITGDEISITENKVKTIRKFYEWDVPTRGQYEVRIWRTKADQTSDRIFDEFYWSALRTFTNEDPIQFPYPLAKTAISIRATEQLNGVIDEINADVTSYLPGLTGGWSTAASDNPAAIIAHILSTMNANEAKVATTRLDATSLFAFHTFCANNGFTYNAVRDYQSSVWDTIADVASVARASPVQIDGKWGIVWDDAQSTPTQHFTPRNSFGFQAEKIFYDAPHALRIRFANKNEDYRQDERTVYADGYSASNATKFESIDAQGITDPDQIWKFGRFHIAQAIHRPERWTFSVDFEYLIAKRGDLVRISHDVLLVGLAAGRVKSLTLDASSPPNVTHITVDEVCTMEAAKSYGLVCRTPTDNALTISIVTNAGDQTTLELTTPTIEANCPAVGDLFSFGESGSETLEALVLSVEPQSDLTARLTCVPYEAAIYTADTGTIPAYSSGLTPLPAIPAATIENVRSDESILTLGAGYSLVPHIGVQLMPVSYSSGTLRLDVQIRETGINEPYADALVDRWIGNEIVLGNVAQGVSYDIRVRWVDDNRIVPGAWATISGHTVVGRSSPPAGLQNATLTKFGGAALIRWDLPVDLDVRYGGTVRFRWSPQTDVNAATWQSSTSIATAAKGDSLFVTLPLRQGTYLARVFDRDGTPCPVDEIVKLYTKQASVLNYADVDSIVEHPTFSGTKVDVVADGVSLLLAGTTPVDDIPDVDTVSSWDANGGVAASGEYRFSAGIDVGSVKRVRVTAYVDATAINVLDDIDSRTGLVDSWQDWDGTSAADADVIIQVRETDDDPAGSPVQWIDWMNLEACECIARGFDFRALLRSNDPAYNIRVDALSIAIEEHPTA